MEKEPGSSKRLYSAQCRPEPNHNPQNSSFGDESLVTKHTSIEFPVFRFAIHYLVVHAGLLDAFNMIHNGSGDIQYAKAHNQTHALINLHAHVHIHDLAHVLYR